MTAIHISHEPQDNKGRYVAQVDGHEGSGEMTYSVISKHRIIVDHTGVDDKLKGLGVGQALAVHVVQDARAKGIRIIPLCPFFKAQAERYAGEWADVVEGLN